jgi:copper transport protein
VRRLHDARRKLISGLRYKLATSACALTAMLALVPTALAHATLVSSTPVNDEVLKIGPTQVVLRFNEPIETAFGSVRVYDGSTKRVDQGVTSRRSDREVAVGLPSDLPRGTYTVAWRVVSADSHPVSGAFVFHVGEPGKGAAGVATQVLGDQSGSQAVDLTFGAVRFLSFALILLCLGGAIALSFVLPQDRRSVRPLWWSLTAAGIVLALASIAGIGLEGAKASGLGLGVAARPSLFGDVLGTQFGRISLVRTGLALGFALVAGAAAWRPWRPRWLAWTAGVLGATIAITPALSGHARVEGGVAIVSDWAHVLAAATWTGTLAVLLLALGMAGGDRWALATRAVPRFSAIAVGAVGWLLAAGAVNGFLEIRSWSGLWETTYGRLLLVKVGLVLPLLGLGLFNNRISVPRLGAGVASAIERRRFLFATAAELGLVVAIVGVTAALVGEPPAKTLLAERGPVSRDAVVGPFDLNLVVDPARTGTNEIHLYLLDKSTGQPAQIDEARVAASLPSAGIGPLRLRTTPAGPGHAIVTAARLPLVGSWRLRVDVRRGQFDQWSTTLTIPIRKDT